MAKKGKIFIGTSGWHYEHWQGTFYPEGVGKKDFLKYYSQRFATAEINNSFYRLPAQKTLAAWVRTVGDEFVFSVKASRYITHMKKLKEPREPLQNFLERIDVLGDKLGPVLFQCGPSWKVNPARLAEFVGALGGHYRFAMEFRDTSWFDRRVYEILSEANIAWCIYHLADVVSPLEVTADFVYIRLHGPDGPYAGSYGDNDLRRWSDRIEKWQNQGKDVYCYFDNDQQGFAAENALGLVQLASRHDSDSL